jgi:glycosyltransferase involved in cell wall biosynthesis
MFNIPNLITSFNMLSGIAAIILTFSGRLDLAPFAIFIGAIFLIFQKVYGNVVPGWTSIITLILFLFGLNFIFLGIIGEYLGRIFLESKNRPRYHINKKIVRE